MPNQTEINASIKSALERAFPIFQECINRQLEGERTLAKSGGDGDDIVSLDNDSVGKPSH